VRRFFFPNLSAPRTVRAEIKNQISFLQVRAESKPAAVLKIQGRFFSCQVQQFFKEE